MKLISVVYFSSDLVGWLWTYVSRAVKIIVRVPQLNEGDVWKSISLTGRSRGPYWRTPSDGREEEGGHIVLGTGDILSGK